MKRSDLVEFLWKKNETLTLFEVERVVKTIFSYLSENLAENNRVELRGFGIFEPRNKIAYLAHNPKTGQKINISSSTSVNFKLGKELFKSLNKN
ncbi:MAG: integration host factor subunit beta [Rickettsiales bacterium]|jgi:integration host factor subunit beta|nr:integration host factor subunit beta [Rickettsiales bacterium]